MQNNLIPQPEFDALVLLVSQSGQQEPEKWAKAWLNQPHPRLAGRRPAEFFTDRSGRLRMFAIAAVDASE